MATQETLPPFPDSVPTAPLTRLSLSKLLAHDEAETDRFMQACCDIGFFYLDLQGTESGTTLLATADKLFQTGTELFQLPLAEKQKYDFSAQGSYHGYKAQGAMIADKEGNMDRNEFYNVSKDAILNLSPALPGPEILSTPETHTDLKTFITLSHDITILVLTLLNKTLGLPESTLPDLHRLQSRSSDQVRFIKAPPQPLRDSRTAMGEHTDFGSVTILFNRLGGLQVLPAGADAEWTYVRPLPGHAIVNLGDALVKFTNGLLRSNIHRVVAPPGEQAACTRYSLVYFARPGDEVVLRRLEGSECIPEGGEDEVISSKEWV
ncbi:oxidoreductase, 2OG-Fe(II) oxygenase family [Aspergillus nomiae NRRL 13137]|uniref:Oxidoreductase, 2OG-Fe(II) oxygenase family n=1 Tax=Aspergillus nomiae NRRL (strain ATCC 15546 / NRRL 13137 / CBS 260.88 / M93) TaxID=1509407 RepID=A0A0L1IUQ1_ASPN3|nr:oxidoreductase, 2OG-Fe(II) oxygenase family [Aspergillus nomiae NRRL 13137]KNG83145.1 oxidoreductase, 2OG-Fe(II) oxygenase family [Aspergillus nomiae NRRL 13137]